MKIDESLKKSPGIQSPGSKEDRRVGDSKEVNFENSLKKYDSLNFEERMQEMAKKIFDQGEKLGKRVDIRELKLYKNMISEFLEEAVNSSHKFSKQSFLDRRGRHKVYAVIKRINEEVDGLTKDVLSSQKDNIGVLKRIDDIRGLIMDIIL